MPHNHNISLQQAISMTKKYREQKTKLVSDANAFPMSETFDKTAFEELIKQPGCTSIRCYFGVNDQNVVSTIFVGVNAKDEDILPAEGAVIVEFGTHCPPVCPVTSVLNT